MYKLSSCPKKGSLAVWVTWIDVKLVLLLHSPDFIAEPMTLGHYRRVAQSTPVFLCAVDRYPTQRMYWPRGHSSETRCCRCRGLFVSPTSVFCLTRTCVPRPRPRTGKISENKEVPSDLRISLRLEKFRETGPLLPMSPSQKHKDSSEMQPRTKWPKIPTIPSSMPRDW